MKLGWMANCQLMNAIEQSITVLENNMKSTSKLVNEAKLEPVALAYLIDQVSDCKIAIKQLKEFWNDLVDINWDNIRGPNTEDTNTDVPTEPQP